MNTLISFLNRAGEAFCGLAWPMFWQSSLLIALIWMADRLTSKRVSPAARYALWMVVLVKLVLPPSLALPTGAAWWLRESVPTERRALSATVSESAAASALPSAARMPVVVTQPQDSALSAPGWALLASVAASLALLGWILLKWREVRRAIAASQAPGEALETLLEDACAQAGIARKPRVRVVDSMISPAVCGLARPALLLPKILLETLPENRIRGVLLHELIHLRRRDIWFNCAQTVLQVVYWWHPLVWLANARIRQLREEAVDDAVMTAMKGGASEYAPALLDVAKLALGRPAAALGLVGIIESKSALRRRIERLLALGAPKKAGLTLMTALGILAFSAVALPMGSAPDAQTGQDTAPQIALTNTPSASSVNGTSPATTVIVPGQPLTNAAGSLIAPVWAIHIQSNAPPQTSTGLFGNTTLSNGTPFTPGNITNVVDTRPPSSGSQTGAYGSIESNNPAAASSEPPTQLSIEVKFIELQNSDLSAQTLSGSLNFPAANASSSDPQATNLMADTEKYFRSKFAQPENLRLDLVPLTQVAGILEWKQAKELIRQIEQLSGSDVLSSPKVTTLSGRQARISILDAKTIVTGVSSKEPMPVKGRDPQIEVNYSTTNVMMGPSIDIMPTASSDKKTISLVVIPQIVEFLGYDGHDSPTNRIHYKYGITGDRPLPHFRLASGVAQMEVPDGQTVVLASPPFNVALTMKDKVKVLGDLPVVGRFFRSESSTQVRKNLIVLVTPTLIDAFGNRLHPAAKP